MTEMSNNLHKFNIDKLKGKPGRIRDLLRRYKLPPRLLIIILGVVSTLWFLIRVIPKPSRASYPCMRVAAPFMSAFVMYLLSVAAATFISRKTQSRYFSTRYAASAMLLFAIIAVMAISPSASRTSGMQDGTRLRGPADGPNQPFGKGAGVKPGRVVWAWNPKATNENCINSFDLYKPENTNQGVVNRMVAESVMKLAGKKSVAESWDALFRSFNQSKSGESRGYKQGEKIFIKINQGTANAKLRSEDIAKGFNIPERMTTSEDAKRGFAGTCETYPNIVLELLRELVYVAGVDQKDISIGDPISHIFGHNYDIWATEFPDVVYADRSSALWGRTLIRTTEKELLFYSDKKQADKLYDIVENADYMINVANLKPHGRAGITLTAKNHFGTQGRPSAFHLHYSLVSPVSLGSPTNNGYGKYRVLVDIMGSKYLGRNTLLFVVDGLYGGGSNETRVPVKYFMPPFNNDWCNSVFMSQDQVALESVCYDFLRTEWNGTYTHSAANNAYEDMANVYGVDDYLHQAADAVNWPQGLVYDPDNSGKPLKSLGVHEHWNDPLRKQYSINLGKSKGIELISIPDTLIGGTSTGIMASAGKSPVEAEMTANKVPAAQEGKNQTAVTATGSVSFTSASFGEGFTPRKFISVTVDNNNIKWFTTESGIVSFNGTTWTMHNKNRKVPVTDMREIVYDFSTYGHEVWIATPQGATVATLPVDARSGATTYYTGNSAIGSENVFSVAVGGKALRWFGTDKGVAAFSNRKWLKPDYLRKYPESMFRDYPITAMATSPDGDSLYVATEGAGVTRVFRNKVDAISGASEYAQWGPIEIPSDKVYSICILPDGTQWFGTDKGAARHTGYNTLDGWTVFDKSKGLVDDFVLAITSDTKGRIWFGTRAGISVYDGKEIKSYTAADGLPGKAVNCITCDRKGTIWIGTDNGVASFGNNTFTVFR